MDTSFYFQGAPANRSPAEYAAMAGQLREMNQNSEMKDMQLRDMARVQREGDATRTAFSRNQTPTPIDPWKPMTPTENVRYVQDRPGTLADLARGGMGMQAADLSKQWAADDAAAKMAKTKADEESAKLATVHAGILANASGAVVAAHKSGNPAAAQAAWDSGLSLFAKAGGDATGVPAKYDPNVAAGIYQASVDHLKRYESEQPKPMTGFHDGLNQAGKPTVYQLDGRTGAPIDTGITPIPPKAAAGAGGSGLESGAGLTPEAKSLMVEQFRKTGALPALGMGKAATQLRLEIINGAAAADKAAGTVTDLAEAKKTFRTQTDALKYFTTGAGAAAFRQQGTILHHADVFLKVFDALDNGNVQLANKLGNEVGAQFGSDKKSNAEIVNTILSEEVGKYLAGAQGSKEEREKLASLIPSFSSPERAKGGLKTLKAMVEGQRTEWAKQRDSALIGKVQQDTPPDAPAWSPAPAAGVPDTATLGKNPRFPDAVWVGKGAPSGGGWYHKNNDGTVSRVE